MMKKILLALVTTFLIVLWACEDRDDNLRGANIRINNISSIDFDRVQVGDSIFYENIASDGFSEYQEFEMAFEEDVLRIETDSTTYNFQPSNTFDPLPVGLYTYVLNINEQGGVDFTFKVD